jgi:DNA-binding transcriptional LysR family regulator
MGSAIKSTAVWKFIENGKRVEFSTRYALTANNILAVAIAASHDCGIINVPEICIANELASGQLVALPAFQAVSDHGVYAIYPHRKAAKKVKVVADFIEATLVETASTGANEQNRSKQRQTGPVDSNVESRDALAHQ